MPKSHDFLRSLDLLFPSTLSVEQAHNLAKESGCVLFRESTSTKGQITLTTPHVHIELRMGNLLGAPPEDMHQLETLKTILKTLSRGASLDFLNVSAATSILSRSAGSAAGGAGREDADEYTKPRFR